MTGVRPRTSASSRFANTSRAAGSLGNRNRQDVRQTLDTPPPRVSAVSLTPLDHLQQSQPRSHSVERGLRLRAPPPSVCSSIGTEQCQRSASSSSSAPSGRCHGSTARLSPRHSVRSPRLSWRSRAEEAVQRGETRLELTGIPPPTAGRAQQEQAQDFSSWLRQDRCISDLVLCWNGLGDRFMQYFSNALRTNCTLLRLDLSMNHIGLAGVKDIAASLLVNSTLQELLLGFNKIGDDGAEQLAIALGYNKGLRLLDISDTDLSTSGGREMASALSGNEVLEDLSLGCNRLGDEAVGHLALSLKINSTLRRLRVYSNRVGDAGAEELARVLVVNTALQVLDLRDNIIGERGAAQLKDSMKQVSSFRKLSVILDGHVKCAAPSSMPPSPPMPLHGPLGAPRSAWSEATASPSASSRSTFSQSRTSRRGSTASSLASSSWTLVTAPFPKMVDTTRQPRVSKTVVASPGPVTQSPESSSASFRPSRSESRSSLKVSSGPSTPHIHGSPRDGLRPRHLNVNRECHPSHPSFGSAPTDLLLRTSQPPPSTRRSTADFGASSHSSHSCLRIPFKNATPGSSLPSSARSSPGAPSSRTPSLSPAGDAHFNACPSGEGAKSASIHSALSVLSGSSRTWSRSKRHAADGAEDASVRDSSAHSSRLSMCSGDGRVLKEMATRTSISLASRTADETDDDDISHSGSPKSFCRSPDYQCAELLGPERSVPTSPSEGSTVKQGRHRGRQTISRLSSTAAGTRSNSCEELRQISLSSSEACTPSCSNYRSPSVFGSGKIMNFREIPKDITDDNPQQGFGGS